jgi:hypothetical protein
LPASQHLCQQQSGNIEANFKFIQLGPTMLEGSRCAAEKALPHAARPIAAMDRSPDWQTEYTFDKNRI